MRDATLCYIERDGKYLMLLRNKKQNDPNEGKWIGVGGKLEKGETPEECARREIMEETGLRATSLVHWGDVYFHSDVWESEIMRLFLVTEFEGELCECGEGELHWKDKEEIFDLNLWDGDRIFLKYLINGRRFDRMELVYSGERLRSCIVDGREEELFDVYNEDGSPADYVVSRDYAHWRGLWHTTAHIWIVGGEENGEPSLLIQLRAACKRLYPSRWDISAAGHIPAGENAEQGAVREIGEELGLRVGTDELRYIGTMKMTYDDDYDEGYHDREHCRIYILRRDVDLSALTLQKSEVESVMWVGYDRLMEAIKNGTLHHCFDIEELEYIRPYI